MIFGDGEITDELAAKVSALGVETYGRFMKPMVEWLAEQTGDERADIGAFILAEAVGMTLGFMLCEEVDPLEVRRYQVHLTDQLLEAIDRVYAKRDEVLAAMAKAETLNDHYTNEAKQ